MRASRAWGTGLAALRAGLVLSVLLTGLVVTTGTAQACSCAIGSPEQRLSGSDAVFLGKVIARRPHGMSYTGSGMPYGGRFVYEIAVDSIFKGDVAPVQEVVAIVDGGSCGITLPARGPVIVYGTTTKNFATGPIEPGQYGTWGCSGSGRATTAPASYGEGWPPEAAPPMGSSGATPTLVSPASEQWAPFAVGAVVLVLLAGLGTALFASRRRDV